MYAMYSVYDTPTLFYEAPGSTVVLRKNIPFYTYEVPSSSQRVQLAPSTVLRVNIVKVSYTYLYSMHR